MSTAQAASPAPPPRTFLGHPLGLYVLFFTEMWERFSYYGMRALLVLYMLDHFKYNQREASSVYKWYTSLVYLTPLLGGFLADRYLGNKWAVIIGAVLMAIGQILLTFEPESIFYAALIFMILGNGFFKPNMSTQVGRLYPQNDPRRDGAYTIFYMGINLGAFLSPLVCGWLAMNTVGGRHTGFMAAGIGMLLGLLVYLVGLRWVIELQPESGGTSLAFSGDDRLPPDFVRALRELQMQTQQAAGPDILSQVPIAEAPPGFDVRQAGLREEELRYDPVTRSLIARTRLTDQHLEAIFQSARGEASPVVIQHVGGPISEEKANQAPSVVPVLNRLAPATLRLFAYALLIGSIGLGAVRLVGALLAVKQTAAPAILGTLSLSGYLANDTLASLAIVAVCGLISAWVLGHSRGALRDRVLTIFVLGIFVVFFWAAFEQAGNALNVWADKATNRYLTRPAPPPPLFPDKPAATEENKGQEEQEATTASGTGLSRWVNMWRLKPSKAPQSPTKKSKAPPSRWGWFADLWNPVATEWFQSINALAIFVLAPLFAWLWTYLGRHGLNPSVPTKMAIGLLLISLAFGLMIIAAERENGPTSVPFSGSLPSQIKLSPSNQLCEEDEHGLKPYQAGRLTYDKDNQTLRMTGVLADTERDRLVRDTAPESFVNAVKELQKRSHEEGRTGSVSVALDPVPPGFDMRYAGLDKRKVRYDEKTHTLTAAKDMPDKDVKSLLVVAGEPKFRNAMDSLYQESARHRVSPWWLFWFYIIATLAELCLSPVGLSMVSKLAPAKFATMLMGLWLLTSFFGNFAAGAFGERWGEWTPTEYFLYIMALLGGAALVLFLFVRKIGTMMHGVR